MAMNIDNTESTLDQFGQDLNATNSSADIIPNIKNAANTALSSLQSQTSDIQEQANQAFSGLEADASSVENSAKQAFASEENEASSALSALEPQDPSQLQNQADHILSDLASQASNIQDQADQALSGLQSQFSAGAQGQAASVLANGSNIFDSASNTVNEEENNFQATAATPAFIKARYQGMNRAGSMSFSPLEPPGGEYSTVHSYMAWAQATQPVGDYEPLDPKDLAKIAKNKAANLKAMGSQKLAGAQASILNAKQAASQNLSNVQQSAAGQISSAKASLTSSQQNLTSMVTTGSAPSAPDDETPTNQSNGDTTSDSSETPPTESSSSASESSSSTDSSQSPADSSEDPQDNTSEDSQQDSDSQQAENSIEVSSDALIFNANNKSSLTLNQKQKSAIITVGDNSVTVNDGIKLVCGDAQIVMSSNTLQLKFGESSIELSSSGVTINGTEISLG